MFGHGWDKADANIVARDAKFTGDGTVATYTFVADVRLSSGETFRATVNEPTIATDFWPPNIGDAVSVLVRSKDHKVKFDKDDKRLSAKAFDVAKNQAFEDAQRQPPGTPPAAWVPNALQAGTPAGMPDVVAKKLAELGINLGDSAQVFIADSTQRSGALSALGAEAPTADPSPEARLLQLKALHERGLLTADEYAEQRSRILGEL